MGWSEHVVEGGADEMEFVYAFFSYERVGGSREGWEYGKVKVGRLAGFGADKAGGGYPWASPFPLQVQSQAK